MSYTKRWSVAIAAALMNAFQTGAFFFTPTVLMPTIVSEFSIPLSLSTLPIAIGKIAYVLLLTPGGIIVDTIGPRRSVLIGIFILATLFFLYASFANSLLFLICIHIVIAGPAAISGIPVYSIFVAQWFPPENLGMPMGFVLSGFSAAGTLFPAILGHLTTALDWRPTILSVVFLLCFIALPITFFFLHENHDSSDNLAQAQFTDIHITSSHHPPQLHSIQDVNNHSNTHHLSLFVSFSLCYMLMQYCNGCFSENILFFLTMDRGMTISEASYFFSSINLCAFLAKIVGGYLGDRFGRLRIACLAGMMATIGIACLFMASHGLDSSFMPLLTDYTSPIILFTILYGCGYGAIFNALYSLAPIVFGKKNLGRTQSSLFGFGLIGNAIGSVLTSILGSYYKSFQRPFLLALLMCLLNFVVFTWMYLSHGDLEGNNRIHGAMANEGNYNIPLLFKKHYSFSESFPDEWENDNMKNGDIGEKPFYDSTARLDDTPASCVSNGSGGSGR